jgi:hypothetical protein
MFFAFGATGVEQIALGQVVTRPEDIGLTLHAIRSVDLIDRLIGHRHPIFGNPKHLADIPLECCETVIMAAARRTVQAINWLYQADCRVR